MKKIIALFATILISLGALRAQTVAVSGTVVDEPEQTDGGCERRRDGQRRQRHGHRPPRAVLDEGEERAEHDPDLLYRLYHPDSRSHGKTDDHCDGTLRDQCGGGRGRRLRRTEKTKRGGSHFLGHLRRPQADGKPQPEYGAGRQSGRRDVYRAFGPSGQRRRRNLCARRRHDERRLGSAGAGGRRRTRLLAGRSGGCRAGSPC